MIAMSNSKSKHSSSHSSSHSSGEQSNNKKDCAITRNKLPDNCNRKSIVNNVTSFNGNSSSSSSPNNGSLSNNLLTISNLSSLSRNRTNGSTSNINHHNHENCKAMGSFSSKSSPNKLASSKFIDLSRTETNLTLANKYRNRRSYNNKNNIKDSKSKNDCQPKTGERSNRKRSFSRSSSPESSSSIVSPIKRSKDTRKHQSSSKNRRNNHLLKGVNSYSPTSSKAKNTRTSPVKYENGIKYDHKYNYNFGKKAPKHAIFYGMYRDSNQMYNVSNLPRELVDSDNSRLLSSNVVRSDAQYAEEYNAFIIRHQRGCVISNPGLHQGTSGNSLFDNRTCQLSPLISWDLLQMAVEDRTLIAMQNYEEAKLLKTRFIKFMNDNCDRKRDRSKMDTTAAFLAEYVNSCDMPGGSSLIERDPTWLKIDKQTASSSHHPRISSLISPSKCGKGSINAFHNKSINGLDLLGKPNSAANSMIESVTLTAKLLSETSIKIPEHVRRRVERMNAASSKVIYVPTVNPDTKCVFRDLFYTVCHRLFAFDITIKHLDLMKRYLQAATPETTISNYITKLLEQLPLKSNKGRPNGRFSIRIQSESNKAIKVKQKKRKEKDLLLINCIELSTEPKSVKSNCNKNGMVKPTRSNGTLLRSRSPLPGVVTENVPVLTNEQSQESQNANSNTLLSEIVHTTPTLTRGQMKSLSDITRQDDKIGDASKKRARRRKTTSSSLLEERADIDIGATQQLLRLFNDHIGIFGPLCEPRCTSSNVQSYLTTIKIERPTIPQYVRDLQSTANLSNRRCRGKSRVSNSITPTTSTLSMAFATRGRKRSHTDTIDASLLSGSSSNSSSPCQQQTTIQTRLSVSSFEEEYPDASLSESESSPGRHWLEEEFGFNDTWFLNTRNSSSFVPYHLSPKSTVQNYKNQYQQPETETLEEMRLKCIHVVPIITPTFDFFNSEQLFSSNVIERLPTDDVFGFEMFSTEHNSVTETEDDDHLNNGLEGIYEKLTVSNNENQLSSAIIYLNKLLEPIQEQNRQFIQTIVNKIQLELDYQDAKAETITKHIDMLELMRTYLKVEKCQRTGNRLSPTAVSFGEVSLLNHDFHHLHNCHNSPQPQNNKTDKMDVADEQPYQAMFDEVLHYNQREMQLLDQVQARAMINSVFELDKFYSMAEYSDSQQVDTIDIDDF
ncbi:hypothetical protein BLOT_014953 [Blomia tropicalis]|nr:hypothetical protein BLOT_014953 [Blomia tropicalis]